MSKIFFLFILALLSLRGPEWGFFGHRLINHHAVFLLPPEMLVLYKAHIGFLAEHAVDPQDAWIPFIRRKACFTLTFSELPNASTRRVALSLIQSA